MKFLRFEDIGSTAIEREYCWYARMTDPEVLNRALTKEDQEQWETHCCPDKFVLKMHGRIRVRKTTTGEKSICELTLKSPTESGFDAETEEVVSESMFNHLKSLCQRGLKKTRFTFACEGRSEKWQIDAFPNAEGKLADWVKIDFELADDQSQPPALNQMPEGFTDFISAKSTDPKDKEFISTLYKDIFLI